MLQAGFESTLGGMIDALKEIQIKGDFMMDAIKEQKEVLVNLGSEVNMAEERLDDAMRKTTEMEGKKKIAEKERLLAERFKKDTRNQMAVLSCLLRIAKAPFDCFAHCCRYSTSRCFCLCSEV